MRLLYQSLSYVPSRRASAVHVMKMCAALARAGHDVTLTTKATPAREEAGVRDDFAYYGVAKSFAIQKLPRPAWRGGGLVHLWHTRRSPSKSSPPDLIYTRDLAGAVVTSDLSIPLVYEAHGLPTSAWSRCLHRRLFASPNLLRLVVISEALKNLFSESGVLPRNLEVIVAHDAADPLPDAASKQGSLPPSLSKHDAPHVGYVGHLYAGRGVELMVALAALMPDHHFHLVGGSVADLRRWGGSKVPSNLHFHGFVAPSHLPKFYRAFDVLLAPYQNRVIVAGGHSDTSAWMSPMKLFEYMAAGKPIVASDLPVLREVLRNRENALLVPPDDSGAWKEALEKLASEPDLARRLAETACRDFLNHYTWDARAASVLKGL